MKFASFERSGRPSWGLVDGTDVVDLSQTTGCPTLKTALETLSAEDLARAAAGTGGTRFPLADAKLLVPVPDSGKIFCIGLNYRAHAAEAGLALPEFPQTFIRLSNSITAQDGKLVLPKLSSNMDYEGELAVIIGRAGRHIEPSRALDHVFGYSCFNDGSIRDYQFKHGLSVGKNFLNTGGFGPWIVTKDEIPDPAALTLTTRVAGEVRQDGRTNDLIFDVPTLISYLSGITELSPGDVIATGTPHGVGLGYKPPRWLVAGDTVEVEISKIGVLRGTVVAEDA